MRAIVVGTGTIGTAVKTVLQGQGHDVVTVGRRSGDFNADISDIESLKSPIDRQAGAPRVRHAVRPTRYDCTMAASFTVFTTATRSSSEMILRSSAMSISAR